MIWLVRAFLLAYALALGIFAISVLGPEAQASPFGALFLVVLGLPWNAVAIDWAFTDLSGIAVAALAPLLNLAVLAALAEAASRRA